MQSGWQHDISELAALRRSVRTFKPLALDEGALRACMEPLGEQTALFGAQTRYKSVYVKKVPIKLGTYGMIHNAKTFLTAVAPKKNLRAGLLQIGYQLEQTVLLAADRGLGTCWLGGTFDKTAFWQASGAKAGEQLSIVLPIGYPDSGRHLLEYLARGIAGSTSRKPFEKLFFQAENGTPVSEQTAGVFAVPLACVRLAPSGLNKQPWRIVLSKQKAAFYLDRGKEKAAPVESDSRYIDLGIAMCHFEAAAVQTGLSGHWMFEDPEFAVPASFEFIAQWA